jgi:hypothetical protein
MAHGGYVSGVVSGLVGGPARVTLRAPPPLGRPLQVRRGGGPDVALVDGSRTVVKGEPHHLHMDVPTPPEFGEAKHVAQRFPGFDRTPSPTCMTCGHLRKEGDGLQIFPSPLPGREVVAAPWVPHRAFSGDDGIVRSEFVWAALDCPGAWALRLRYPEGSKRLTVRMAGRILQPVRMGETCVVIGWPLAKRRRVFECGSALFGDDGTLRALTRASWLETADPPVTGR